MTLLDGLKPPARTDVHTAEECDEVLALLGKAMRRARLRGDAKRYDELNASAGAWLDERNLCTGALAMHAALETTTT